MTEQRNGCEVDILPGTIGEQFYTIGFNTEGPWDELAGLDAQILQLADANEYIVVMPAKNVDELVKLPYVYKVKQHGDSQWLSILLYPHG